MRFRSIASACLLVAVSAGGVKTMAASPDCARWIKDYQQGMAKRAVIAKRHVVHAAYHVGVPRPKVVRANAPIHQFRPPRLSPQEMLKRFKVLCGEDLPGDALPVSFAPTDLQANLLPSGVGVTGPLTDNGLPVSFAPADVTGGNSAPSPVIALATPPSSIGPSGGGIGGFPGVPIIPGSPSSPGTPGTPGTPNQPDVPTTPVTPIEPVTPPEPVIPSPVPEPGSLLLLATGALAAVPVVLRRRR